MTDYSNLIQRSDTGALMPEEVSREIIKNVPEQGSVALKLARRLPNMSRAQQRMPVLSALPVAYFVNEAPQGDGSAVKKTTEVAWANKYLDVAEVAVIVPIPENVLDDADYDIWGEIRPLIEDAMGKVIDDAILYGHNAPTAWPDDICTAATAAGNVVEFGTGADLYDDLLGEGGVVSLVEEDGYFLTGGIAAMSMRAKFRSCRGEDGQPLFTSTPQEKTRYQFDGAPVEFPRSGVFDATHALLIAGDFNQMVYSIRQDITYKMLTEAVITDSSKAIIYNLPQEDMVAMRVTMRLAWQVPNPINYLEPTEGDRYPFALLTPTA
jgi:HK97 family phage major capsid protein